MSRRALLLLGLSRIESFPLQIATSRVFLGVLMWGILEALRHLHVVLHITFQYGYGAENPHIFSHLPYVHL